LLRFSTLSDNIANGSESGDGGGAIFNDGGDVFITRTQFDGNQAPGELSSGGAILSVDGSILAIDSGLSGNIAGHAGGAVDFSSGYFRATDTTFSGNRVGFTGSSGNFDGYGGAVAVSGSGARAVFDNASFDSNLATEEGGAVWVAEDGNAILLNNTSFVNNQATFNSTSRGGAIFVNGHLRGLDFSMSGNKSRSSGGGIYIFRTGSASLELGQFSSNDSEKFGGAVFNGNFLDVSDSVFDSNEADDAGAIYTTQGKVLIQSGNQLSENFPNNFN